MSNHGRCYVWNVQWSFHCRSLRVDQTRAGHTSDQTPAAPWIYPTTHRQACTQINRQTGTRTSDRRRSMTIDYHVGEDGSDTWIKSCLYVCMTLTVTMSGSAMLPITIIVCCNSLDTWCQRVCTAAVSYTDRSQ